MFSNLDQRSRLRTLFIVIILLTLPCYCFGMILLFSAQGNSIRTPTATGSVTDTPTVLVTETSMPLTETLSASTTATVTPTWTASVTYTQFSTYTPTITPTFTNTATNPPTSTDTPVPDTATPTETEIMSFQAISTPVAGLLP